LQAVWPTGWCLARDGNGGVTVVRADDSAPVAGPVEDNQIGGDNAEGPGGFSPV